MLGSKNTHHKEPVCYTHPHNLLAFLEELKQQNEHKIFEGDQTHLADTPLAGPVTTVKKLGSI
jgi:hypothetical protein